YGEGILLRHHQLSMSDSNVADFFSKGSPASVRQGTLFEIKLNGADFSSSVNMFHLLRVQEIVRIPITVLYHWR
ncbi:hypothetical protein, partial [Escherichia coli]|uniref:hypothetical protein n=1 Tax=Escherichia coli TaxID=562 RepID=UPI003D81A902